MSLDFSDMPLSAPFRKVRTYVAIALFVPAFAFLVFLDGSFAVKQAVAVREAQQAEAFAQGTWCSAWGGRMRLTPVGDQMLVAYDSGAGRIDGLARVHAFDGAAMEISIFDRNSDWFVARVDANTLSIWQFMPAVHGSAPENWTRYLPPEEGLRRANPA